MYKRQVFARAYAPSTLGSFLRAFTFGHVRQLDAVASRFLTALAAQAPQVLGEGTGARVLVDVDDTIIEVHGYAKQGAGFGYSGVRGLNALVATATTTNSAPVVVAQRLRKGSCGSPRGAKRLVADALKTVRTLHPGDVKPLLRADSAFYGAPTVGAAVRAGAQVSVTVRLDPKVQAAIAGIRRTTSRPGTRSGFFLEVNAVNGTSATSPFEIHVPLASSKIASGYLIVVHACSSMPAIAALTAWSIRTVTDTCAPPVSAAWTASRP